MDMAPDQAPPAPIIAPAEYAPEILRRLDETRKIISELQATGEGLPVPLAMEGRDAFLATRQAWWATSPRSGMPAPREALATALADVMRDDARLRALHGTLPSGDGERLILFARSGGGVLPSGFSARELVFAGIPYAGAVVVAGESADAPAWLFMPDQGWTAHASLSALHAETEARIRHTLVASDTLPGLRVEHVDRMLYEPHFVDSRPVAGAVIARMASDIIAMEHDQVADAWNHAPHDGEIARAADAVRSALNLHARLNIDAMQLDRQSRLLKAHHATRLAAAPPDARTKWLQAASDLRAQVAAAEASRHSGTDTDDSAMPIDLADPGAVRARRDALIARFAGDGADAALRTAAIATLSARMAVAVADARLRYYVPTDPPSFIDDHAERGYQWMQSVLDSPAAAGRRRVEGHEIVVRQFTHRGAVVGGLLAVGVCDPSGVPRIVLYTPDAPDGRSLREFEDASDAARHFLYAPAFEAWLLDRLPASHAVLDTNGERHFAIPEGTQTASWVLERPGGREGFTRTAEPFATRDVAGDVFETLYAADLSRLSQDMTSLEAALRAANPSATWQVLQAASEAVSPLPRVARELLSGLGRGMQALWRVEDAIRAGDHARAFVDATEAYVNLLALTPAGHAALRPAFYARAWSGLGGLARIPPRRPPAPSAFDTRYAAPDTALTGAAADVRGLHLLGGRRYIVSAGTPFEVRFDAARATWRLHRQGAADAQHGGPAIEWTGGRWRLRHDMGLRGGRRPSGNTPPQPAPDLRTVAEGDLDGLTVHQRGQFLRVLRQRLGGARADDLHADVLLADGRSLTVGRARFDAWSDALHAARQTSALPPAGAAAPPLPVRLPWREVPPLEWPDAIWYYPPGFAEGLEQPTVYLPTVRIRGSGVTGLVTSPLDPALYQARHGAPPHGSIQIHLRRMNGRATPDGQPQLRVFVNDQGADPHYILRTPGEVQGEFLVLRPGEFSAGT